MEGLRIAIPTGALLEPSCTLLRDAGVAPLRPDSFDRQLLIEGGGHRFVRVRPTDVPVYVEMGACDAGIVGKDVLWESDRVWYELVDLHIGGCRLVLAALRDSPLARGEFTPGLRVATKYPRSAARYFDNLGVAAELIKLHGSVELAPSTGLADAVLDIVDTGRTLAANRLVEVAEAERSTARLIVNHASLKTRGTAVNQLAVALRRMVRSRAAAGVA